MIIQQIVLFLFLVSSHNRKIKPSPVFLVPGYGGSKLYIKVNYIHHGWYIHITYPDNYHLLWMSIYEFMHLSNHCFYCDDMKLRWSHLDRKPLNKTGVDIKTGQFGNPTSVDYLTNSFHCLPFTRYFANLISTLTSASSPVQYSRNKNLFGIPYDFRLGLNDLGNVFHDLKTLVEKSFHATGSIPVTMVAHSYGCILTARFLENQTLQWRTKYIRRFISISGPYGGSIESLEAILIGPKMVNGGKRSPEFKKTVRTFPSTFTLLPTLGTLLEVGNTSYSYNESEIFIKNLRTNDTPAMLDMFNLYKGVLDEIKSPEDVELHCIYSKGLKTINKFKYSSWDKFPDSPTIEYTDGDETIRLKSLHQCKERHPWATLKVFDDVSHLEILQDRRLLAYVRNIQSRQ